jgi:type I restriction enzyme S subunit
MIDKENLPKGWTIAKFEDLLDYIQPTNYIVKSTEYKDTYKTPVLTAGKSFIKGYTNETDGIFNQLPTIIFDDFTTATQFVNFPFKVKSSAMKILQPTCDLVNIKLAYYLMQIQNIKGETHKRFWISEYSQLTVPLAPLNEQKRIIDKIEELITDLDKGIEYLETSKQQLKVYRHAVLKWAFTGDYELKPLGKVAIVKRGKSKHRPRNAPELFGGKYPFIQTGDVRAANGRIVKEYTDTYSEFGLKQSKLWPKGTLCLTIAANIADTAFLGFDACFPDSVVGITSDPNVLNLDYVNFYIQKIKQEIEGKASATAQKNINVEFLEALEIPMPKPSQQVKIIHDIESRLSVCEKIVETIENSMLQAEALRLSIIKKAFEGKLVPQNPSDEPAEKLLERIRTLRKAQGNQGKEKPDQKLKTEKNIKAPKKILTKFKI